MTQPTEALTIPSRGATVAYCPLPACRWASVTAPGPAEHPAALADVFGVGVFAAHAASERHRKYEREIREHLTTHPLQEWVRALLNAQARTAELESMLPGLQPPAPAESTEHRPDDH